VENHIPYTKIADHLDIQEDDILLIASDITKLSYSAIKTEGKFDPNKLIDSFKNKLGKNGTLLFPSYNFLLESGDIFDIKKTKPFLCGALSIAALESYDFRRTKHPLHSFLVWGKHAEEICNLNNKSSFGKDSPFAFLYNHKAKMLCIDIDLYGSFTFTHYVEEMERVKYRRMKKYKIIYTDKENHTSCEEYFLYKKYPGIEMVFQRLEENFKELGIIKETTINNIKYRQILLDDNTYSIIKNDIRYNKAKSIAKFNFVLFLKDSAKFILKKLNCYTPLNERINNAFGL
jgi:aminoglycoside 3-N-acetyltransferase